MERAAYTFLKQGETSWWYKGRAWCVRQALRRAHLKNGGNVLDFGSGFGASFDLLRSYGDSVDAYEVDGEAFDACKTRGYARVFTEIPTQPHAYSLVGAFDVVEHIEDDLVSVKNIRTLLKKDGVFVLTVPAYAWLWSAHDELHRHFRRYHKKQLCALLEDAGFTIVYASYWNMTLMPLAYLLRKMGKGGGESLTPGRFVNSALSALMWIESRILGRIPLPWGTGIVVVARV